MIYSFTGHRPPKAGLSYDHTREGDEVAITRIIDYFAGRDVDYFIVGGALGFDTLAAIAARELSLDFKLFIPFEGQESVWPAHAQERYRLIRANALDVVVCSSGGYAAWKMQKRNEAMVDASDGLIAWWDGSQGGTSNCVRYATKQPITVFNLYTGEYI